jgi:hypothetical protein
MANIRISASHHGTSGEVVAVEDGLVVWAGPLEEIAEAWPFDALFCHDDDEEWLFDQLSGSGATSPQTQGRGPQF